MKSRFVLLFLLMLSLSVLFIPLVRANPDSVSDSFTDETKIASKNNVYVNTTGGYVNLVETETFFQTTSQCTTGNDARVESQNASYAIAHSVGIAGNQFPLEIGQYYTSGEYHVMRNFLKLDTTSIPSETTIFNATLSIYGLADFSSKDFYIRLQKWTGEPPMGVEDFNLFDGINYDDGLFNSQSFQVEAWNNITVRNFTLIQKEAYTKICIRSSLDISETPPTTTGEYVRARTSINASYAPKLYISYGYVPANTYNSTSADGRVYYSDAVWSTCRNAGTGSSVSSSEQFYYVRADNPDATYQIARHFYYFDTSAIPDSTTITNVILSLYVSSYNESSICAQKGTQANTLTTADYDSFSGSLYGYIKTWSNQYNNITFSAQGRTDINKTGTTKICVREYSHDYLNVAPTGNNRNSVYFNESSTFPILKVSWSNYESSGTLHSTNLLNGKSVSSIDSFNYTISSLPAQTTAEMLFSQDNATWYNSTGGSDWQNLSSGTNNTIDLSSLGWSGANFYYLCAFNNTDDSTPQLHYVSVIYTTTAGDSTSPTYSNVGRNTTIAASTCLFYARWSDNVNMSGYIFGTNNTGSWTNDTWVGWTPTGTPEWSNVSKTLNANVGVTIQWRIWANDTSNNWNNIGIQSFTTTSAPNGNGDGDDDSSLSTYELARRTIQLRGYFAMTIVSASVVLVVAFGILLLVEGEQPLGDFVIIVLLASVVFVAVWIVTVMIGSFTGI